MSFHTYMETFAEAWVAANTQTPMNLQMPPRGPESRPLRPSDLDQHELPTMLSKEQIGPEHVPIALIRSQPLDGSTGHRQMIQSRHLSPAGSNSISSTSPFTAVDDTTVAIHCIIEPPVPCSSDSTLARKDTYIVLPGFTPFKEAVQAVLLKAGYSHGDAMGAKGSIMIKQWQPLSFDTVCKDPDATVHQVLGDLTNVATLKIKLYGYSPDQDDVTWNDQTVRCAVNELLKEMNQCKLAKLSPLSQSTISNIANSKYLARIGTDKCREFGTWYRMFRQNQVSDPESDDLEAPPKDTRLTFHPTFELPKMREWYRACKAPSDQVLRRFLDEINEGHVRQQRPKITLSKMKIWWKNEKQRERRIQQKKERALSGEHPVLSGEHPPQDGEERRGSLSCLDCHYQEDGQGTSHGGHNPNMNHMTDPMMSHS